MEELVRRAMRQDNEAFWQLYELKWRSVLYTATKILGNSENAEDAAQEAFLRAYKDIGSLKEPKAFDAWLYRIVINVCNRSLSKSIKNRENTDFDAVMDSIEEERGDFSPAESFDREHERRELLNAIDSLTNEQRAVILLHYYQHMSYADIAEVTGVSTSGVTSRLRRARTSLKEKLVASGLREKAVSALLAAPIVTQAIEEDAQHHITSSAGAALKSGLVAAIAKIATAGIGAGAVGTGAAGTGAATTGVGSGAAAATSVGMTATTKLIVGTATVVALAGAGAGVAVYANAEQTPEEPLEQAAISAAPLKGLSKQVVANIAVPSEPATKSPTKTKQEVEPKQEATKSKPTKEKAPKSVSKKKEPAPITTLADMIGTSNASKLVSIGKNIGLSRKGGVRSFLGRVGLTYRSEQRFDDVSYVLYVLEKQDKRLRVIERVPVEGDSYGISYVFENKTNPLPGTWELELEY